jgi:hypothetical protein
MVASMVDGVLALILPCRPAVNITEHRTVPSGYAALYP